MEYRRLGRTGLKVSPICLGCMTFGREIDQETSFAIMDHAFANGINFFDTANVYSLGISEEITGKWIKERGRRDQIVLATKVRGKMGDGPNDQGLSRRHIMQQIEASLRRLQTDYVDLYQVHSWDPETPLDETLRTLNDLVHQGKVRYLGASNFAAWQLCKALWISDVHGWARFDCLQPPYSLVRRGIEQEILPFCADQGIGVIPYSPLAGGFLTGKHKPGQPPPPGTRFTITPFYEGIYYTEKNFRIVEALQKAAAARGVPMVELAIAWVMSHPTVTAPIIGARNTEQVDQALRALAMNLSPEARAELTKMADEA